MRQRSVAEHYNEMLDAAYNYMWDCRNFAHCYLGAASPFGEWRTD